MYGGRIDDRYLNLGQQRPQASRHELEEAVGAALVGTVVRVRQGRRSGMRDRLRKEPDDPMALYNLAAAED